jgi:RHS repeat-associated protein
MVNQGNHSHHSSDIFDRNFIPVDGGFIQMTTAAKEHGQDVAHELLSSGNITIKQPGYVYVYLSNEETSPVEVYFDDFKVTHTKSAVVQVNDYYPFGLTFNSYSRENSVPQKFKFNSKEEQDELSIAWLDFGARMFQPELGRFFSQDRFSENYFDQSPYHYVANNPLKYVDINGDSSYSAIRSNAEVIVNDLNTIYKNKYGDGAGDAFTVTTGTIDVTKTVEQDVEFDFFDMSTWDGKQEVTITEKQEVYFVATNADSKFDWNTDKYSQATFDVLNTNRNIEVLAQKGDTPVSGWPLNTTLQQEKGHAYKESQKIGLWSGLNTASKGGWSFGGTFLHEAINHFHPLGDQEPAHPLQNHFGLSRSSINHPGNPRMKWSSAERNRLDKLRNK